MNFNITYDPSVSGAPADFKTAINAVASFFSSTFTDSVTVNIDVGYGEVHGSLMGGALGQSLTNLSGYTYSDIRTALHNDIKSAGDTSAYASLPATDPTPGGVGNYWVPTAEAEAMGLAVSGGSPDGWVGFSSTFAFDYDRSDGITAGQYDFYGVVAHEFSEVMGRQMLVGQTLGTFLNSYEPLDLFHFRRPARAFSLRPRDISRSITAPQTSTISTPAAETPAIGLPARAMTRFWPPPVRAS